MAVAQVAVVAVAVVAVVAVVVDATGDCTYCCKQGVANHT